MYGKRDIPMNDYDSMITKIYLHLLQSGQPLLPSLSHQTWKSPTIKITH